MEYHDLEYKFGSVMQVKNDDNTNHSNNLKTEFKQLQVLGNRMKFVELETRKQVAELTDEFERTEYENQKLKPEVLTEEQKIAKKILNKLNKKSTKNNSCPSTYCFINSHPFTSTWWVYNVYSISTRTV